MGAEIIAFFQKVDGDGDKKVSFDEFKAAFAKIMKTAPQPEAEVPKEDGAAVTAVVVKEDDAPKPEAGMDEATEKQLKTLFDAMSRGDEKISKIDLIKYLRENDEFVSTFG